MISFLLSSIFPYDKTAAWSRIGSKHVMNRAVTWKQKRYRNRASDKAANAPARAHNMAWCVKELPANAHSSTCHQLCQHVTMHIVYSVYCCSPNTYIFSVYMYIWCTTHTHL